MRTSIGSTLFGGLVALTAAGFTVPEPVAAQVSVAQGTCVAGAAALTFSPGLGSIPTLQTTSVDAVLTNCTFTNNLSLAAAPIRFIWTGQVMNGCTAASNIPPVVDNGGFLYWNDGTAPSTLKFTSLTFGGTNNVAPTIITFVIASGHMQGAQVQATVQFVPSANQLGCSNASPILAVTGTILTVTVQKVSL